jgi:hypothetical protein
VIQALSGKDLGCFKVVVWVLFLKYCSLMIEFFKNILEKVFDSLKIIF